MPLPLISPPLINSSNPWATTKSDLLALYNSPHTGAVTTRTALLSGFPNNPGIHQHTFFNPTTHTLPSPSIRDGSIPPTFNSSLNTYGYSPHPLFQYLSWISEITTHPPTYAPPAPKPFIISITGTATEVSKCIRQIAHLAERLPHHTSLLAEINLSCPNIPSKPPPAYSSAELAIYLSSLPSQHLVPVGIKTPPYTYAAQFSALINTLVSATQGDRCPISFISATNTLGSSLVLNNEGEAVLASATGEGIGGLAGGAIHALSVGNVRTLSAMIAASPLKGQVDVIGIGGVGDGAGYKRMRKAGAKVVGVGTMLGVRGVEIFEDIETALELQRGSKL